MKSNKRTNSASVSKTKNTFASSTTSIKNKKDLSMGEFQVYLVPKQSTRKSSDKASSKSQLKSH